jgi:uncharacterized membrane protein
MEEEQDHLHSPPTQEQLIKLARRGALDISALERALKITGHTPSRAMWVRFLDVLLLILSAGFLVSGIFFFFAFNWTSMNRFVKLGLLEAGMLIAVGVAFWRGLSQLSGKIALGVSALLVGALLAVYGQIYQTGADSYELFLGWALLITGWVLIGKFTPLWFFWILLFNVGLPLYWEQLIGDIEGRLYLLIFLLNAGAILAWEIAHRYRIEWLKSPWAPRLLSILAFAALVVPTMLVIFESWYKYDRLLILMLILFLGTSATVLYTYSQIRLDLFMLTVCAFSLIITFNSWISQVLGFEIGTLFILAFLFIGQAALVTTWFRRIARSWEAKNHG